MGIDGAVEDIGLAEAVQRVEQLVAGQHAAVRGEERREQAELGRRQDDGLVADRDLVPVEVHHEVVVAQDPRGSVSPPGVVPGARRPSTPTRAPSSPRPLEDALDPEHQLGRRERLRDVVVGARSRGPRCGRRRCRAPTAR